MSSALKMNSTSRYTSDRVFNDVRKKTGDDAVKHFARVKKALEAAKKKVSRN